MRLLILPLLLAAAPASPPDSRTVMVTGFERLRIDGPFVVKVTSGGPPGATIEAADRRALDGVSIRNLGGQLVIGLRNATFEGWSEKNGPATITVSARDLRAVTINGGGRVAIDRLRGQRVDIGVNGAGSLAIDKVEADQLAVTLTGTGAITLNGGATRTARFNSYGAGSIDAAAMPVNDLTVHSQTAGDSRFTARFTAAISSLGTGAVRVTGGAACMLTGPGPASCAGKTERR